MIFSFLARRRGRKASVAGRPGDFASCSQCGGRTRTVFLENGACADVSECERAIRMANDVGILAPAQRALQ